MRCINSLILAALLLWASTASATGTLTRAANPTLSPGITQVVSLSAIPFIKASTGSMGNNGAVTAMTALPRTFSSGAYLWLPAGAIAAGVPAAASWYWFVASSTTAGTVYNSTYTSGTPQVGVLTPFVTTGPGAFTGATNTITAISVSIPGNTMGPNGRVDMRGSTSMNATAGSKTITVKWGATSVVAQTLTNSAATWVFNPVYVHNRGVTNLQVTGYVLSLAGTNGALVNAVDATEDTTLPVAATITLLTAVATDHIILENYEITVKPDVGP